ncbi:MAG: DUF3822 family protein [Rikenellaceae bacterium]|jgi:hypothetical protein|nr:DUF3822 family protein [Rikenellaceae bacterium]
MVVPVGESNRGSDVSVSNRLSIQLRLDGLSYALVQGGQVQVNHLTFRMEELPKALAADDLSADFSAVWVCVPTRRTVLIPSEWDRPEKRADYLRVLGFPVDQNARVLTFAAGENRTLLFAVDDAVAEPLEEKYGEKLAFYHPLGVSLTTGDDAAGSTLRIDAAGETGSFTLTSARKLLLAEVYPLTSENELLLSVNRTIAAHPIGRLRIVCSGDRAESSAALLAQFYREVTVDPDGENRNLLFPFVR